MTADADDTETDQEKIEMKTKTTTRALAVAVGFALLLPACTKSETVSDTTTPGGADASFDEALAAEPIPDQDVADAAAEEEITEANANAEFEALKKEIESDN